MIRAFPQHIVRQTRLLDGSWDFVLDPDDQGRGTDWQRYFPPAARKLFVPGCWNNELGLYSYEGVAWFRTMVNVLQAGPAQVIFHGILGQADVFLDGEQIGSHYGGWVPFTCVVPQLAAGRHQLIIRTDSTHGRTTIPLDNVDWFHYGGIMRSVEWQTLPDVFIASWGCDYTFQPDTDTATLTLQADLRSLAPDDREIDLAWHVDEQPFAANTLRVGSGMTETIRQQVTWTDVRRWDVGDPQLYTIRLHINHDDLADRIGFRTVGVHDGQIMLNDRPIVLKGVNRHEEHPEWGFAFPPKLMAKDLDIMERLGCNAVRGSHYPNNPYFLDLLDERGLLFWEEIPLWGFPRDTLSDPLVQLRALTMTEEMIRRDRHRPSIILWGAHNEMDTRCNEALDLLEKIVRRIRDLDPTRLVVCATMHPLDDRTLHLYDVIGINKYYGWYEGSYEYWPQFLDDFHAYAAARNLENIPIIMAEFGAAGLYGDTGWEDGRLFSEDHQADVLAFALKTFASDPKIIGTFVWQFADVRTDVYRRRDRARSFNNKGIVNEYRKPKRAFEAVQRAYRDLTNGV